MLGSIRALKLGAWVAVAMVIAVVPAGAQDNQEYLELVERFAPILVFDTDQQGYPMSAQDWFDNMLCGQAGGPDSVCFDSIAISGDAQGGGEIAISLAGASLDEEITVETSSMQSASSVATAIMTQINAVVAANQTLQDKGVIARLEDEMTEVRVVVTPGMAVSTATSTDPGLLVELEQCDPDSLEGAQKIRSQCATMAIPYQPTTFTELADVPTYYDVEVCGSSQVRIRYWWYYGHQPSCLLSEAEATIPGVYYDLPPEEGGFTVEVYPPTTIDLLVQGEHIADWEHVDVILSEDRSQVAAVTFFQHGGWYTRIARAGEPVYGERREFEIDAQGRPIVYVGRSAHGAYHNTNRAEITECAYFDDNRRPGGPAWVTGSSPFVDVTGDEEAWLAANRTATWNWGYDGIGTHITQSARRIDCEAKMCGDGDYDMKNPMGLGLGAQAIEATDGYVPIFQKFAGSGCWESSCPTGFCGGLDVFHPTSSADLCFYVPWPVEEWLCEDFSELIADFFDFVFNTVLGSLNDFLIELPYLGEALNTTEGVLNVIWNSATPRVACGKPLTASESFTETPFSGNFLVGVCDPDAYKTAYWIPTNDGGILVDEVPNVPPVAKVGDDYTLECRSGDGTLAGLDGHASYDSNMDPLSYTWTGPFPEGSGRAEGKMPIVTLPLGMSFITLVVNDGLHDSDPDSMTITVEDKTSPTISCPADLTLEYPASTDPASTGAAAAQDSCSTATITRRDLSARECGPTVTTMRSWKATDEVGNSSQCLQTIAVVDTTPPDLDVQVEPSVVQASGTLIRLEEIRSASPTVAPRWLWQPRSIAFGTVLATSEDVADPDPFVRRQSIEVYDKYLDGSLIPVDPAQSVYLDNGGIWLLATSGRYLSGRVYRFVYAATDDCGNTTVTSADFSILGYRQWAWPLN